MQSNTLQLAIYIYVYRQLISIESSKIAHGLYLYPEDLGSCLSLRKFAAFKLNQVLTRFVQPTVGGVAHTLPLRPPSPCRRLRRL